MLGNVNKPGALFQMGKAPAFQFYANDFMDSTRFMEANAVGLYVRCLCIQWTQGGLPPDVRTLSKGVGMDFEEFERVWPVIASKFEVCGDGLMRNNRLEVVRSRQEEISSKRSNAGKAGAIAKANASANGQAKRKQRKVKVEGEEEREVEGTFFEVWWTKYSKGSRKLSAEVWDKMPEADRLACIEKTPAYIASKPDPLFRKDGERFLKHRTWEDPIVDSTPKPTGPPKPMTLGEAHATLDRIRVDMGIPPGGAIPPQHVPANVREAMQRS